MNEIVVVHPFGFGDHLICNGLINSICNKFDRIWLPTMAIAPHNNYHNVIGLYSDNDKVNILPLNRFLRHWELTTSFKATYEQFNLPIIELNMHVNKPDNVVWYEWFYRQAGVAYQNRLTHFRLPQKFLNDTSLLKEMNPTGEPYILVHNSWSTYTNFNFNWEQCLYHNPEVKKIFVIPDKRQCLLDWTTIILGAEEIHVTPSSLFLLVWHLAEKVKARKYFHDVRNTQETISHEELKLMGWNVVDYEKKY